jgi:hypothetical protein
MRVFLVRVYFIGFLVEWRDARIMAYGKKPKISAEEGFVSAVICLCIEDARTQGKVIDLEPIWKKFKL